ncbi:aldo/keto reductase [Eleftheria terrae]|uniref:aldo/keto reductase n=1 Tax=Eleftheria terrae TaxID=1597781 RepID=UPI00263A410E|nr:aldo/keto reductase [Eleftheria terrae]WKB54317.1 aldo/keto reductase [Eleftheria terrae]
MELTRLGRSELNVSRVCLGTMTFGEQVDEAAAHALLDHAVASGINFLDTAEMYPVPARAHTFSLTEAILGRWLAARPGLRERVVLASKVSGPSRGYDWIRNASPDLTADDIIAACEASLKRLKTDRLDLYQIHWPARHVPMFGGVYFEPQRDVPVTPLLEQLQALDRLVRDGKVRAIGLSNETPYGVAEFVHLAERHGLARVATVQNPYSLVNRTVENGLDEVMYRHGVSLLAYSPLAFGTLTGKYDEAGFASPAAEGGRLALFETMQKQRWGRPETLATARRYNELARRHGLTPTRMALAFCYSRWQVASTIIGVTTREQLDENLQAWGTRLDPQLLAEIDRLRWEQRDPAQ